MADNVNSISPTDLMKRCKRGDKASFRELYDLYKDRIYSTCFRLLGNVEDAEDAVQETFIRIFRGIKNFRGDSSLHTWIYRIAVNTSIEQTRKMKHDSQHDSLDDPEKPVTIPAGQGEAHDVRIIVEKEIEQLPSGCRTVFVLHTVEGFKHREIAEMLDISEGTSKSQLYEAKDRLRKQLLPYMEVLRK